VKEPGPGSGGQVLFIQKNHKMPAFFFGDMEFTLIG
jgi:hypothetical protein